MYGVLYVELIVFKYGERLSTTISVVLLVVALRERKRYRYGYERRGGGYNTD